MVRAYLLCLIKGQHHCLQFSDGYGSHLFFKRKLKPISMNIYTGKFIDSSLKQIPKQNNHYSKYLTVFPFTKYHSVFWDFEAIEFPENFSCYLIPLNNIFGPIGIDDIFYFNNLLFYILYKKEHDTFLLKSKTTGLKLRIRLNLLVNKKLN